VESTLYSFADRLRSKGIHNGKEILKQGLEEGLPLTYEDLYYMRKELDITYELSPRIISEFIKEYIGESINLHLLDPWCRFGEIINSLSKNTIKSVGISPTVDDIKVAAKLNSQYTVEWFNGNPLEVIRNFEEDIDIIASCLPFNFNKVKRKVGDNEVYDFESNILLLESSSLLTEQGIGFFVVPSSFFFSTTKNSVKVLLEKFGIYIDAAFYMPPGTFENTSIETFLLAVSKKKEETIFVAELSNKDNIKTIIKNWRKRTAGKILSLGFLTSNKEFVSYVKIEKELEIHRLAKKTNLSPAPFKSFALEVNTNKNGEFEEKLNSIYIPLIGLSNVFSRKVDLILKEQNYLQIVLNSDIVSADYLANWFNTELGKLIRESIMTGTTIKRINKTSLMSVDIYIPSYETQIEIISLQSNISNLKSELTSIESQLWTKPETYRLLKNRLRQINRNDSLEEWFEQLPFPLASILWKYYATKEAKEKKEYLLYFFEAFAQFQAVLMLSAFQNDKELVKGVSVDPEKITRSTFGTWVVIGEQLAKLTRTIMSGENKERCLRMFRNKKRDLIDVITSKKVYQILKTTNGYRNEWRGHGGVEGVKDSRLRLKSLEAELIKLRELLGDAFEGYKLIKPGMGYFESGLHNNRGSLLVGSRSTFKEELITTVSGMDINHLYLFEEGNYEPLQLLPFIKLMPSPRTEENACYFYNKIENDRVKMISYYFDRESEVTIEDDNISSIINGFRISE
jgi:hypothetical protein